MYSAAMEHIFHCLPCGGTVVLGVSFHFFYLYLHNDHFNTFFPRSFVNGRILLFFYTEHHSVKVAIRSFFKKINMQGTERLYNGFLLIYRTFHKLYLRHFSTLTSWTKYCVSDDWIFVPKSFGPWFFFCWIIFNVFALTFAKHRNYYIILDKFIIYMLV